MRRYTNLDGEKIEVSQEHLDTALKVKRELQMESASHKCNWSKHKKLMEKEGFFDSEASENYRCMIKNYQSDIGELPSATEHADLVSTSKLNSIKEATGEMYYAKREMQFESRGLQKIKRELSLYGVIAEQVYEALVNELKTEIPTWAFNKRLKEGSKRMVVLLSDWHTGAVVINVNGNSYNYEIAKKRINLFYTKIYEIAIQEDINDIDIICLGDMTEHVSMRNVNQSFEAEFHSSKQTVKAFELIRDLIVNLTQFFNVTFRGVSGNHDRMNGRKEDNIDGDSTIFIINYMVKLFSEYANLPRFEYHESDTINYSAVIDVNGALIKAVHGDNEKGNRILASHNALDGVSYNMVCMGHIHHYDITEVGLNQFEAYFGSLMGSNNYGKKAKYSSGASQGIVIVDEFGEMDIRRINVQII